jgi:hypothetical protein
VGGNRFSESGRSWRKQFRFDEPPATKEHNPLLLPGNVAPGKTSLSKFYQFSRLFGQGDFEDVTAAAAGQRMPLSKHCKMPDFARRRGVTRTPQNAVLQSRQRLLRHSFA